MPPQLAASDLSTAVRFSGASPAEVRPEKSPSSLASYRPQSRQQSIEPGPLGRQMRPAESVPPSSLLSRVSG